MVDVTIGQLLEEAIANASKIIFENDAGETKRDSAINLANLSNGSATVLVTSESDLPPLINGFRTLDIDKNYLFTEPGDFTDNILIPAGWVGDIRKSFNTLEAVTFTGTGSFFNTLNIDGVVDSLANSTTNPGVKTTVTTSVAHGLLDGQFVNITGTTDPLYSLQRLQISNVTTTTFDIEIVFVADDSGLFNTGYESISFIDFTVVNADTGDFMDITSSKSVGSLLLFTRVSILGFSSIGFLRSATNYIVHDGIFAFVTNGLTMENIINGSIQTIGFVSLNPAATAAIGVTITGSESTRIEVSTSSFIMSAATQHPVRIDGSVTNAQEIIFQTAPDNDVADDYFDTSAGGLDQTNPQVITRNNGIRPNSASSASVGFTNVATPIVVTIATQDVPVIIDGTQFITNNLERAVVTVAGQITNITKVTKKYAITFSGLIEKVAGGSTDIGLLLIINGVLDLSATFEIPHSVNAGIIQISATRDFELAENDTIDIAVVNFDGNANISVSQANISYSE